MSFFRHQRFRIGILLAALMFTVGALPGLAAAAQGVQLQAPLCTPDGSKPAQKSDTDAEIGDHCQICPLAAGYALDARPSEGRLFGPGRDIAEALTKDGVSGPHTRGELMPQNGRAPPLRI